MIMLQVITTLHLLPLMMELELMDIKFFIKSIKSDNTNFNIMDYLEFSSGNTRSHNMNKLKHRFTRTSSSRHFFFNRLPRLWNSLPPMDLEQSVIIIMNIIRKLFWSHFLTHFSSDNPCSYHFICPCNKCSHFQFTSNLNSVKIM